MITRFLISHRGNTDGKNESLENDPTYIDLAIKKGFDVEVDVWYKDNTIWLGHDEPMYDIAKPWFTERKSNLWIHCKNKSAIDFCIENDLHFFWHNVDDYTMTSKGYIWAYPNKEATLNCIAVLPERNITDVKNFVGVCSDFINMYKNH
jgi:hypothetical protein